MAAGRRRDPGGREAPFDFFAKPEEQLRPPRPSPGRRRFETAARVGIALPWVAFAITIVAVGGLTFTLAMVALAFVGLAELFRMASRSAPFVPVGFAVVGGLVLAAHFGSARTMGVVVAAAFPLMFLFAAARSARREVTRSMAITVLGIAWVGLPFAHAVLLRDLPMHGDALLVDVLVATFVADTAAYGGGRLFGRRPLAPSLSPNKTVEGLAAGLLGGTLGFWIAGLYQDWLPGLDALVMGACVAAIAPLGDLFESMVKRDFDVKDTGRAFGPHGGLLDRLDAALFTIVAGYYLAVAFVF